MRVDHLSRGPLSVCLSSKGARGGETPKHRRHVSCHRLGCLADSGCIARPAQLVASPLPFAKACSPSNEENLFLRFQVPALLRLSVLSWGSWGLFSS